MDFALPENNIQQFGLREGMKVADLGAGSGHYTIAAARAVGETGRVYSIEIQKELLQRLKILSQTEGVHNVEILWGDIEEPQGTKLRDYAVDAAILSNILFQLDDKGGAYKEARRILKPGEGRLLVIDWTESFGGMGPEADSVFSKEDARALAEANGFIFDRDIEAGAHHYGFIMKKS